MTIVTVEKQLSLILKRGTVIELDDVTECLLINPNGKTDADSYIFSLKDQQVTVRYTPRDFQNCEVQ